MRNLGAEAAGIGLGPLSKSAGPAIAEDIGPPEASKAPWWGIAVITTGGVASIAWTGFLGWLLYRVFSGV
jgi:hypothetical protein